MRASAKTHKRAPRLNFSVIALSLVAVGCVLYAVTALAAYWAVRDMRDQADARHEALETQLQLEKTLTLLAQMEGAQNAYNFTGRAEFLAPLSETRMSLRTLHPLLSKRLAGWPNPAVQSLQSQIDQHLTQRLLSADNTVAAQRVGRSPARPSTAESPPYDSDQEVLKTSLRQLSDLIQDELERSSTSGQQLSALSTTVVAVLTFGGSLLMLGALWALRNERAQRDLAEQGLVQAQHRLEQQVLDRTAALREAMQRIQSFTAQLDERIEEERRRLSREVHDQLGQIATAAKMVTRDLARTHPSLPRQALEPLVGLLDEAITTSRRIAAELRPPMLDDLGLAAAVQHHLSGIASLAGIKTTADVRDDELLQPAQANQLFRILQEASTNVLRHAQANHLQVRGSAHQAHYTLEINDDGQGPQRIRPDASGLRNMKERAGLAGGTLSFGSLPTGGTSVVVKLPVQQGTP